MCAMRIKLAFTRQYPDGFILDDQSKKTLGIASKRRYYGVLAKFFCQLAPNFEVALKRGKRNRVLTTIKPGAGTGMATEMGELSMLMRKLLTASAMSLVLAVAANSAAQAAESLQDALRIEPQHAATHIAYASVLQRLGRRDEALASLEQAARLDSSNPEVHKQLGIQLRSAGRVRDAADTCHQSSKRDRLGDARFHFHPSQRIPCARNAVISSRGARLRPGAVSFGQRFRSPHESRP